MDQELEDQKAKLRAGIDMELSGHPTAHALAVSMLNDSCSFWKELGSEVDTFFNYLLTTMYGASPTAAGRTECWTVVLTLLQVVWRELRKVRVVAETAYGYSKRNPSLMVGQYMWALSQAHCVQNEFLQSGFWRHPKVSPGIMMYLFEHRAPKAELLALLTRLKEANRTMSDQKASITKLQTEMNWVMERLNKSEKK